MNEPEANKLIEDLWDIDPEAAGYLADIRADMSDGELEIIGGFDDSNDLDGTIIFYFSPQGGEYWYRIMLKINPDY